MNVESKVALCESIIEYVFTQKLWCTQSLQTSGQPLVWQNAYMEIRKNDGLAVLGDVMSKAYLCERWYGTGRSKGQWDVAFQALLSNPNLDTVGRTMGLDRCVILNGGTLRVSEKTMATTVEAILGAVYLDGGMEALARVMTVLGLTTHAFLQAARRNGASCGSREFLFVGS